MLVVDCSVKACDDSLLICSIENEFRIKRYRTHPTPHLINPENGRREELPTTGEWDSESRPVFGVITTSSRMRGQASSTTARRCETDMRHAKLCTVLHSFAYFSKMGRVSADLTG